MATTGVIRRAAIAIGATFTLAVLPAACGGSSATTTTTAKVGADKTRTSGSGGSAADGASKVPPACELVTAADVEAALGTAPVTPPQTDTPNQCAYSSSDRPNYVAVVVQDSQSGSSFNDLATSAKATAAVQGIGDRAFETPEGAQAGSILVMKGDRLLRIDTWLPIDQKTSAGLQQLATDAVGRM